MKRHLLNVFVIIMFCGLSFSPSAQALPSLGVIPTATLSTWPSSTPLEGPFGFTGGDPTSITVWIGNESGPVNRNVDVYIGSTEDGHTFRVNSLFEYSTGTPPNSVPSFWHTFGPNYAAEIGNINDGGWMLATSSNLGAPLVAGGGEFWTFTAAWTGGLGDGQWIYAMADLNGGGIFQNGRDDFSPPTMSTVPEPSTVLLLGSCLIGLALLGRRRFRNRKA